MKIHCSCICKRSGKDINEKVIKGLCPKRITPDVTAYSRIQVWPSGKHLTMRLYVKSVAAPTTWQQRKESNFKVEWEGGQFSGYLNNPGVQNYELFLIILQNNNNTWLILFLNPDVKESNLRKFPKRCLMMTSMNREETKSLLYANVLETCFDSKEKRCTDVMT